MNVWKAGNAIPFYSMETRLLAERVCQQHIIPNDIAGLKAVRFLPFYGRERNQYTTCMTSKQIRNRIGTHVMCVN